MIANILIACGFFALGALTGFLTCCYKTGKALVEVSKHYKEETGNDFISWIKHSSAEFQIKKLYEHSK